MGSTDEKTSIIAAEAAQKIINEARLPIQRNHEAFTAIIKSDIEKATKQVTAERDHYKMLTQELGQELRAAHASEKYRSSCGCLVTDDKVELCDIHSGRIEPAHASEPTINEFGIKSFAAHASEPRFDPDFQIPPEIMEAAYAVHNYAIRSGFKKGWCIGPVCDRRPTPATDDTKRLDWLLNTFRVPTSFIRTAEGKVTRQHIDAAMRDAGAAEIVSCPVCHVDHPIGQHVSQTKEGK